MTTYYSAAQDTEIAAALAAGQLRILVFGDSLAQDPLLRREIDRWLRTVTHNVLFVGDQGLGAATGGVSWSLNRDLSSWAHAGVNGNTIAQATARVATVAAALGEELAPHIVVDITSTNDISQLRTLEQIRLDKLAFWAAIRGAWPKARVVSCAPPLWRSGSASGVNWADKLARRNEVVAALPVWVKSGSGLVVFCDAYAGQSPQEISDDGVHPGLDGDGQRRGGRAIAKTVLQIAGLDLRRPREADGSLRVAPREGAVALQFVNAANDRVTWTATAALTPESESFALAFWFVPTSEPATVASIVGVGPPGGFTNGVGVCQMGDGLTVYLDSETAAISGDAGYADACLKIGEPNHIALVCDRAANKIALAVNGKTVWGARDLVAAGHAGANWVIPVAGAFFYMGKFVVQGAPGLLREVVFYKGADAPRFWELNEFAESGYADGVPWPGVSAYWRCNEGSGAPLEAAGVVAAGTVTGATWGTWPGYAKTAENKAPLLRITSVKTAAYTASIDELVPCDPTAGAFPVTLPLATANNTSRTVVVKNDSGSTNQITIAPQGGQTIDGIGSEPYPAITQARASLTFVSLGTRWIIT